MKPAIRINKENGHLLICKYNFPDEYPMDSTRYFIFINAMYTKNEDLFNVHTNVLNNTIQNLCDKLQAYIYIHKGLSMLPDGNVSSNTYHIKIEQTHKELLKLLTRGKK